MTDMSVPEYAKHRGVHERSIRRYLSEGHLERAVRRQGRKIVIDAETADKTLDKLITTRKELLGVKTPPSASDKSEAARKIRTSEKAGTAGLTFHEARTLTQRYKAALLKLELDEKTGRLADVEAINTEVFNKARAVRDTILNIPDRISPILAAESDPARVSQLLEIELTGALEELSEDLHVKS